MNSNFRLLKYTSTLVASLVFALVLVASSAAHATDEGLEQSETSGDSKPIQVGPSIKLQAYLRLKVDAAYNTLNLKPGNYGALIQPQPDSGIYGPTNEFVMTANQSRVGVDIEAPPYGGALLKGKVEFDFYNPATQDDKRPIPMLRQGYMSANWKDQKLVLIAGETYDLFGELTPNTLDFEILNWNGNIGYRRPMVRVDKTFDIAKVGLKTQLAVTKEYSDSGLYGGVTDEDSPSPGVQSRVSVEAKLISDRTSIFGVYGAWGNPRVFSTSGAAETGVAPYNGTYSTMTQWLIGMDMIFPVSNTLQFAGKLYRGQDLRSLYGLSQGTYNGFAQPEHGGWLQGTYEEGHWIVSVGYAMSEIEENNLVAAANAYKEITPYGTVIYKISEAWATGFTYEQLETTFQTGTNPQIADRYQVSVMMNWL